MCGRYSLSAKTKDLENEYLDLAGKIPLLRSRYNIAPSQEALVILQEEKKSPRFDLLRWGLVPSWAKEASIGARMINARAETLLEKPSYRGLIRRRRCLVVADGFYEWKAEGGKKQPYYARLRSGESFTFAGLWDAWLAPNGSEVRTFTIITTAPNELMRSIHDRMPVILPAGERGEWLFPGNSDTSILKQHLKPYPPQYMEAFPVSTLVNSPGNDVADCVKPAKPNG
ncbi:MAG: SOS response-associated peptidase [Candidatus Omnitrophica bacterium]|nr:SOS response-associated peptidase [Candidatus Omnitrophota bacterium]